MQKNSHAMTDIFIQLFWLKAQPALPHKNFRNDVNKLHWKS